MKNLKNENEVRGFSKTLTVLRALHELEGELPNRFPALKDIVNRSGYNRNFCWRALKTLEQWKLVRNDICWDSWHVRRPARQHVMNGFACRCDPTRFSEFCRCTAAPEFESGIPDSKTDF